MSNICGLREGPRVERGAKYGVNAETGTLAKHGGSWERDCGVRRSVARKSCLAIDLRSGACVRAHGFARAGVHLFRRGSEKMNACAG